MSFDGDGCQEHVNVIIECKQNNRINLVTFGDFFLKYLKNSESSCKDDVVDCNSFQRLEFHDFYNYQCTHGEKNVKLYYYLKVWIIVVHDHFQNIFNILEIE